jgi:hypothetical protein
MNTYAKFTGHTFISEPARGWDYVSPPKLGIGHESARVGAKLAIVCPRGDVASFTAVVTEIRNGGSFRTIELVCEVVETELVAGWIRPGHRIRIDTPNSWILLGGPCNVDPFGFSGTIAEIAE